MALFLTAYNTYIVPNEGGYSFISADKGGETYAGISRKNFPNWSGWTFIDKQKVSLGGTIPHNKKFEELKQPVSDFYSAIFKNNNFNLIKNQDVANILFDWFINSGYLAAGTSNTETFGVDEILNRDFNKSLPIDKRFDLKTIEAINSVDSKKLYETIRAERKKFYEAIIKADPTQKGFEKGWMKRINNFPLTTSAPLVLAALIFVALIFITIKK